MMNVYDLLRALATGTPVDPARARVLIDRLEEAIPELADIRDHDCVQAGPWFPDRLICRECGRALPAGEHHCAAGWDQMTSTGEHGGNVKYAIKCIVCGREMTPGEVYLAG